MSKYLDNNGLKYVWGKIKGLVDNKVDREDGKGLSTHDFTDADRTKLDGLENYTLPAADADTLGGVKVGAGLTVTDGVLSANAVNWDSISNKPDLAGVYQYKGSVADFDTLPKTDNQTGDVWNVETNGMNYAWDGTAWDALGAILTIESIGSDEIDRILAETAEA